MTPYRQIYRYVSQCIMKIYLHIFICTLSPVTMLSSTKTVPVLKMLNMACSTPASLLRASQGVFGVYTYPFSWVPLAQLKHPWVVTALKPCRVLLNQHGLISNTPDQRLPTFPSPPFFSVLVTTARCHLSTLAPAGMLSFFLCSPYILG